MGIPREASKHMQKLSPPKVEAVKPRKPRSTEGLAEAKAAATMTSDEWKQLQVGMAEKWPAPEYMKTRDVERAHTCYMDETYAIVTRWLAETRIKYRPHAKSPGSKSHVRYESYAKAQTVGEALALGSYPVDWCWDYERGFIKVLGPVRDEPLNMSKVVDESTLTDVDHCVHRWYTRELAKNLGLKVSDLSVNKASGEALEMRAHRLVAQREAKKILEAANKEKRRISDEDVEKVLTAWAFAKNVSRVNVMPDGQEWVFSDTVGLLRDRVGDIHLTAPSTMYPDFMRVINRWLTDRLPSEYADFTWTSINLNCNYAAKLHRDGNNFGPSFLTAFGDFEGGELTYFPEDNRSLKLDQLAKLGPEHSETLSLKSKGRSNMVLFNGNCAHSVAPFKGQRYSVVYFTCGCFAGICEQDRNALKDLGIPCTPVNADRYKFTREPRGYESSSRQPLAKIPRGPRTHAFISPEAWERAKFVFATPQKLTGCAEQIRLLMEKGHGIRLLREDKSRKVDLPKPQQQNKQPLKEHLLKLQPQKQELKRPAGAL